MTEFSFWAEGPFKCVVMHLIQQIEVLMPSSGVFFILLWLKTFRYGNGFLCLLRWSRSCPMNLCSSGGERVKALSDPHPGNSYTGGLALLLSNTCRLHFTVLYGQRGESLLSLWHSGVGKRGGESKREHLALLVELPWPSPCYTSYSYIGWIVLVTQALCWSLCSHHYSYHLLFRALSQTHRDRFLQVTLDRGLCVNDLPS